MQQTNMGAATSFAQGLTRSIILTVLVVGFFVTIGIGFWLGKKWFGDLRDRAAGLPLTMVLVLYFLVAIVLLQFW